MKPHPRLRRAALVTGTAVSVLLVAVWIASARWYLTVGWADGSSWSVQSGCLHRVTFVMPDVTEMQTNWKFGRCAWPFEWWVWPPTGTHLGAPWFSIPLWHVAGLAVLGTAAVWRLDARARRRARVGACAKCGYDRAGLAPASPCPECGTKPGCGGGQP